MVTKSKEYVNQTDVVLPADALVLFQQQEKRKRRPSFLLADNLSHLHSIKHRMAGTTIVYCYLPRLKRVKRAHGKLVKMLPGFRHVKFTRKDDCESPILKPFMEYVTPLYRSSEVNLLDPRTAKGVKEAVATVFKVFISETPTASS